MSIFRRKPKPVLGGAELERLTQLTELPTFPQMTLRVLQRLRDPEVDFDEVSEALQWDPTLVARLLRLVNSAAYGTRSPIQDVRHAVSFLGRGALEQIVVAVAVKGALPSQPSPGFDPRRFWHTASRRAALARALCDRLQPAKQAESFTAGLLSDLAVPLLANSGRSDYGPVLVAWHGSTDSDLEHLEREALGFDHAQVGAHLGRMWELPAPLVHAIENHHSDEVTDAELPAAVRLVGVLRETQTEHGLEVLVETARSDYGLEPDWVRTVVDEVEEQADQLLELMA